MYINSSKHNRICLAMLKYVSRFVHMSKYISIYSFKFKFRPAKSRVFGMLIFLHKFLYFFMSREMSGHEETTIKIEIML